jgi:hypothetical protein
LKPLNVFRKEEVRTASACATAQRGDECQRRLQRACSRDSGRRRAVVSAA